MGKNWSEIWRYGDAPQACGVYAIYVHPGRLVYLGSSSHLRSRLGVHVRGGRFGRPCFLKFRLCQDGHAARSLERRLIRRIRPEQNRVVNVAMRVRGASGFYSNPYDGPGGY